MDQFSVVRKAEEEPERGQVVTYRPGLIESSPGPTGLLASWDLILHHKRAIITVTLVCVAASWLLTLVQQPTYRVRTVITVEARNEYFLNLREIDPTLSGDATDAYLSTQTRIVQSESMIRKAITKLKRPVPIPEGMLSRVMRRLPPAMLRNYVDTRAKGSGFSGTSQEVVTWIENNLSANPVHQGQTIELTFDSPDAQFGADFLNALSSVFMADVTERRLEAARSSQVRLNERLEEERSRLEESENDLQQYARSAGLMFTSDKKSTAEDQLRVLEQELATARADRIAKESLHDIAGSSSPDALPPVQDSMTLRDYESKLADLRRRRAELSALFTDNHPDVKAIQAQIQEIEAGLASRRTDVVQRIGNDYEAAQRRETLLAGVVAQQSRRVANDSANSVRYNVLEREVETNRTLYDAMLQRASNAWLALAMETSNIHVVDPATPPSVPFKPRVGQNILLGAVGGLVMGMLLVLIGEGKDRRIHSPVDLRSNIDLQQLGVVPYVQLKPKSRVSVLKLLPQPNESVANDSYYSSDALADSFRATVASIIAKGRNGLVPQSIIVTSATTGDGKTTVVCNLGIALAEVKARVLLIDGDSRNPTLHRIFGLRNDVGLIDVLRGDLEFGDAVITRVNSTAGQRAKIRQDGAPLQGTRAESQNAPRSPGLYVMCRGSDPDNAVALFYSKRMDALLEKIKADFDVILIDTPPVIPLPHARVLGRRSDGVVLVVRSGWTSAALGREALMLLESDSIPTLGTILNAFDFRHSGYSYPYQYRV